ncbi:MAG: BamA/TamA family outer membrane protein [Marinifilaceae bacterium]
MGSFLGSLSSCSSTKYVPENEYLLNKVVLKVDDRKIAKDELKRNVKQNPNLKILGMWRFHLGLFNLSGRNEKKGLNKWLRRIGEEPVIYEAFQTQRSVKQLQIYLRKKGYYNSIVKDSVIFRKKKAKVFYFVEAGKPYRYRNVYDQASDLPFNFLSPFQKEQEYVDSSQLKGYMVADSLERLIRVNDLVDSDVMNNERARITKMLKNKGYFNFSREYVHFMMDSSLNKHQMDVFIGIRKASDARVEKKYRIRNTYVHTDYDPKMAMMSREDYGKGLDTLLYKDNYFIYRNKLRIKPEIILQANYIRDSVYYNLDNVERTYSRLQALLQYKFVNIKFEEIPAEDSSRYGVLDCHIQLTPLNRQSYSVEVEGTNSSGNLGVAGNLNYQHKNLFGGAEIFDLKFTGALETQRSSEQKDFNTMELGGEGKVSVPQFLLPFFRTEKFRKSYNPKTSLSLSYNFQRRPDYTRTIANVSFGYFWNSSKFKRHTFNPIELNFVDVLNLDEGFINQINNLYIRNSFTDHVISTTRYSFVFNNQNVNRAGSFRYLRFNFELAGNMLNAFHKLTGRSEIEDVNESGELEGTYFNFIGIRYAQYVRSDIEFRYHHYINKANTMVYRLFFGAGLPYGNMDVLPFEKSYFAGGANGIRAWQVRSLGPGSYNDTAEFPNNSADLKLEANLEYRFKLFWALEGALFLDAGNIWALSEKDDRVGANFHLNRFYKEIALGTGFGARVDLNFILFRLDLGLKVHDPSEPMGKRWVIGRNGFSFNDLTYNIGIGYPF